MASGLLLMTAMSGKGVLSKRGFRELRSVLDAFVRYGGVNANFDRAYVNRVALESGWIALTETYDPASVFFRKDAFSTEKFERIASWKQFEQAMQDLNYKHVDPATIDWTKHYSSFDYKYGLVSQWGKTHVLVQNTNIIWYSTELGNNVQSKDGFHVTWPKIVGIEFYDGTTPVNPENLSTCSNLKAHMVLAAVECENSSSPIDSPFADGFSRVRDYFALTQTDLGAGVAQPEDTKAALPVAWLSPSCRLAPVDPIANWTISAVKDLESEIENVSQKLMKLDTFFQNISDTESVFSGYVAGTINQRVEACNKASIALENLALQLMENKLEWKNVPRDEKNVADYLDTLIQNGVLSHIRYQSGKLDLSLARVPSMTRPQDTQGHIEVLILYPTTLELRKKGKTYLLLTVPKTKEAGTHPTTLCTVKSPDDVTVVKSGEPIKPGCDLEDGDRLTITYRPVEVSMSLAKFKEQTDKFLQDFKASVEYLGYVLIQQCRSDRQELHYHVDRYRDKLKQFVAAAKSTTPPESDQPDNRLQLLTVEDDLPVIYTRADPVYCTWLNVNFSFLDSLTAVLSAFKGSAGLGKNGVNNYLLFALRMMNSATQRICYAPGMISGPMPFSADELLSRDVNQLMSGPVTYAPANPSLMHKIVKACYGVVDSKIQIIDAPVFADSNYVDDTKLKNLRASSSGRKDEAAVQTKVATFATNWNKSILVSPAEEVALKSGVITGSLTLPDKVHYLVGHNFVKEGRVTPINGDKLCIPLWAWEHPRAKNERSTHIPAFTFSWMKPSSSRPWDPYEGAIWFGGAGFVIWRNQCPEVYPYPYESTDIFQFVDNLRDKGE